MKHTTPLLTTALMPAAARVQELSIYRPLNRPPHWPFGALDPVQARNHRIAHALVQRIEQQRQQQRLRECLEALGESPV